MRVDAQQPVDCSKAWKFFAAFTILANVTSIVRIASDKSLTDHSENLQALMLGFLSFSFGASFLVARVAYCRKQRNVDAGYNSYIYHTFADGLVPMMTWICVSEQVSFNAFLVFAALTMMLRLFCMGLFTLSAGHAEKPAARESCCENMLRTVANRFI